MAGCGAAFSRASGALAKTQALSTSLASQTIGNDGASHIASGDTASGALWKTMAGFINALLGGQVTHSLPTRARMVLNPVPAVITTISTSGFATAGDGGAAVYIRAPGPFSDGSSFQSQDGAWWQLQAPAVIPEMFGALGNGSHDDTAALQNAINFVSSNTGYAGTVSLRPGRTYLTTAQIVVNGQIGFALTSGGGSGVIVGSSAIASGTAIILFANCWKCELSANVAGNGTTVPNILELHNTGMGTAYLGAPMAECIVRDCTFGFGQQGKNFAIGIRVTDAGTSTGTNNLNSEHKFHRVHFLNFGTAGISIETSQSLQNDIDRCGFSNEYPTVNNTRAIQTVSNTASGAEHGGGGFVARHCLIQIANISSTGCVQFYLRGDCTFHDIQIIGCESEDNSMVIDIDDSTVAHYGYAAINFINCWSTAGQGGANGTSIPYTNYIKAKTATVYRTINWTNCTAAQGTVGACINLATTSTGVITLNISGGLFSAGAVTGSGNINIFGATSTVGNNVIDFDSTINLNCIFFSSIFQVNGVPGFSGTPFYSASPVLFDNDVIVPLGRSLILSANGSGAFLSGNVVGTTPVATIGSCVVLAGIGANAATATAGAAMLPANPIDFIEVMTQSGLRKIAAYSV